MIYLIKVWDGMEKIFEVNFTPARYRITYETA